MLSSYLFSQYIRGLLRVISTSGVGCKWTDYFVNVLAYADDIVLIAPPWEGLQRLISLLHAQACSINLTCNVNKTVCMMYMP